MVFRTGSFEGQKRKMYIIWFCYKKAYSSKFQAVDRYRKGYPVKIKMPIPDYHRFVYVFISKYDQSYYVLHKSIDLLGRGLNFGPQPVSCSLAIVQTLHSGITLSCVQRQYMIPGIETESSTHRTSILSTIHPLHLKHSVFIHVIVCDNLLDSTF